MSDLCECQMCQAERIKEDAEKQKRIEKENRMKKTTTKTNIKNDKTVTEFRVGTLYKHTDSDTVVLATQQERLYNSQSFCGVKINQTSSLFDFGEYSNAWSIDKFQEFEGTIVIDQTN